MSHNVNYVNFYTPTVPQTRAILPPSRIRHIRRFRGLCTVADLPAARIHSIMRRAARLPVLRSSGNKDLRRRIPVLLCPL